MYATKDKAIGGNPLENVIDLYMIETKTSDSSERDGISSYASFSGGS